MGHANPLLNNLIVAFYTLRVYQVLKSELKTKQHHSHSLQPKETQKHKIIAYIHTAVPALQGSIPHIRQLLLLFF